jgi:hypothetical protein
VTATGLVPRFAIGAGYAVYRGATTTGHVQRHAAFQIAVGIRGDVAIMDASGIQHRAAALVVPPMEPHCQLAIDRSSPTTNSPTPSPNCWGATRPAAQSAVRSGAKRLAELSRST